MKQHILDIHDELIVDNFAGGGGASTGIELALGRHVDIAINHDPDAVAMHTANHPQTHHYCESVWEVDPREVTQGRPVGLVWLSPDCKHFSKAKGGKPVEKKIRGLAWVALRWAATVKPRVIMLENVEEFTTWGPLIVDDAGSARPCPKRKGREFNAFVNALKRQGYQVEWRELRACDYGAPTIRKRLFMIARRDGLPIVWPDPTHGDPEKKTGLPAWRTAADCIDWSIPCPSIFERKRPLAEATLRRIAKGIMRYVVNAADPFIVKCNHTASYYDAFRGQAINDPLKTITASHGTALVSTFLAKHFTGVVSAPLTDPAPTVTAIDHNSLVSAHLMGIGGGKYAQKPTGTDKPIGTLVAENHKTLVTAHLTQFRTNSVGSSPAEPAKTITAGGEQQRPGTANTMGLVASHLVKLRGTNIGQRTDAPLQTISAQGTHFGEVRAFLLKYYGNEKDGAELHDPMHTVTARDRFGLVTVAGEDYMIADIGMRMLTPRELYRAQGFPETYIIGDDPAQGLTLPKYAQVRMCGNSVCPPVAAAIVRANVPEIAVGKQRRAA